MNLIPEHLVQIEDRTAGAVLTCHGCRWTATIDTGAGHPIDGDDYAAMRREALALRDSHQWPALRFGVVEYVGADRG